MTLSFLRREFSTECPSFYFHTIEILLSTKYNTKVTSGSYDLCAIFQGWCHSTAKHHTKILYDFRGLGIKFISWQCFFFFFAIIGVRQHPSTFIVTSWKRAGIHSVSFLFQSRKKFIQVHNIMGEQHEGNHDSFFIFGWTIPLKGQILLINNMLLQYNQVIFSCRSFNMKGIYQQKDLGPIQQPTIVVVDQVKGQVLRASGRNM